ncbi:UDP-N-acetylmuramate--L-alanine ligase [Sphingomicrobium lutaoense]|uniref:UDP-N-acetylmuramate--alanine ligase n=1 Tax=Sphingomicrobium lutaoense TaxID=515949 RepID=A0A839Z0R0_9SPHN|nr:Mur ligase family protein [Sphingomicrobium lutaoense]MBB3764138.1 UDP-N-acetylmuramate--alanine ligase [Sphingomicrobium lutaoense]
MTNHYFFCGIGGSGMLPLAAILRARGMRVSGSDRSLDAGRTAPKFDYLRSLGIELFPQDGSGVREGMTMVASAAVEDSVPDMVAAREHELPRMTRPDLLAELLNGADRSIAVGGTSGKSTVTGMIAWMLVAAGRQPTVMNGAVMKNFASPSAPFASALAGDPELFVSEVDESDGSIAYYRPTIALVNNISLDHKSMEELRSLFGGFLDAAKKGVVNLDDEESAALAEGRDNLVTFGFDAEDADLKGEDLNLGDMGTNFIVSVDGERIAVALPMRGRHNASNALAALAAVHALGVPLAPAAASLARFAGLKRRLELIGESGGVQVYDDFGHNPDKVAATLETMKDHRLRIMFQPHGYGPLRQMGEELARVFARHLKDGDCLYLSDPVYQGGTVDRSRGSGWLADAIRQAGGDATHIADRDVIAARMVREAEPGDVLMVMGARDDSLIAYAQGLVAELEARG